MIIVVVVVVIAFLARIIYVSAETKKAAAEKSKLNRDVYKHAYRLGLSYDDLQKFETDTEAKADLTKVYRDNLESATIEGKTQALQIAESALKVAEINNSRNLYEGISLRKDLQRGKEFLKVGNSEAEIRHDADDFGRIVAVVHAEISRANYDGRYIFMMEGVKEFIEEGADQKDLSRIDQIEYTDGLRFTQLHKDDDVTEYVEETAIPLINRIYGRDKGEEFRRELLRLYISMGSGIRAETAVEIMLHYIDNDDLPMLLKWLKPYDYMIEHEEEIVAYLEEKGVSFEKTGDLSKGFYFFHRPE